MAASKVLCSGSRVIVHSLSTTAVLNGEIGRLMNFDSSSDRWEVRIDGAGCKKVRPANLVLASSLDAGSSWSRGAARPLKTVKLCRYGDNCWRPSCHFFQENNGDRCKRLAAFWCSERDADCGDAAAASNDTSDTHIPKQQKVFDDNMITTKIYELEKRLDNVLAEVSASSIKSPERVDMFVNEERIKCDAA